MDILAPVPKTPSKLVPPVLILLTIELKLSSLQIQESPQNKISRRMILLDSVNLLPSYPSFTALSPHLLPYLHIVNAPYPIINVPYPFINAPYPLHIHNPLI